jgi:lipid A 3-O-deacylase
LTDKPKTIFINFLLPPKPRAGAISLRTSSVSTPRGNGNGRLGVELPEKFGLEFIPDAGITAGNVFTYGELGGIVRFGRGLKANWGPELIRPGYSGTSYFEAARARDIGLGIALFGGVQGRAIARNIFLDGNSFASSRSVPKNYLVGDLIFGLQLFYSNYLSVSAAYVTRSSEFHNQGGWDKFGSINGSFEF